MDAVVLVYSAAAALVLALASCLGGRVVRATVISSAYLIAAAGAVWAHMVASGAL